jgi:HD superfamily phosphohydrolase
MISSFLIVSFMVTFSVAEDASQNYSGRQDNAWVDLQKELGELKVKLDAEQGIVSELLESKKNIKGVIAEDQVEQLRQHDKKLQELTKEYTKKLNDFDLKYPEKGQELGRQYSRKKSTIVSIDQKPTTLDSRVQKINKKIKEQYRGSGELSTVDQIVRKIKAKKNPNSEVEKTKPIDVTDKMTVVK